VKFSIRKLCSSTEEFEGMADCPIDLESLGVVLSKHPDIDVAFNQPVLQILLEDEGVVIKLYSSGKALIQANMKEDAERACLMLAHAVQESIDSDKTEM
jgi:hypothetical protein